MERERKKPVTHSTMKKEPVGRKIANLFIKSDFESVKKWVIEEKLVPGATNLFLDTLSMFLTGDSRYRSSRTNYNNSSRILVGPKDDQTDVRRTIARSRSDYRDIIFASKEDAMDVVDAMKATIDRYERGVSILDLFDFADKADKCTSADDNYGWKELPEDTRSYVIQTSEGYELRLPGVVVLPR